MNIYKIGYWVATAILCLLFLFSASMYFTKYEMVKGFFSQLGYPTYLIYPLAVAKVLGVVAVLYKKIRILTEWAYAGFFFDAVLAFAAHYMAGDGGWGMALVGIIAVVLSRGLEHRVVYAKEV